MVKRIITVILIMVTSLLGFGCGDKITKSNNTSNNIENNQSKEIEQAKNASKQIESENSDKDTKENLNKQKKDIFSGIWVSKNKNENIYLKIRENEIEFQTNRDRYFYAYGVKEINEDYETNSIELIAQDVGDSEGFSYNLKLIDKETLNFEGKTYKKLVNVNEAVQDLQYVFEIDTETASTSNGLNEFLEISEADVFECFNMHRMENISQDEINQVRSLMSQEEAEKIAMDYLEIDGEYYVSSSEIKFGNKIGYTVIIGFSEDGLGPQEEIFVEASTKEIGVFIRGLGYAQMINE